MSIQAQQRIETARKRSRLKGDCVKTTEELTGIAIGISTCMSSCDMEESDLFTFDMASQALWCGHRTYLSL